MNPALSVVAFTTLAGLAQGMVVALATAMLGNVPMDRTFLGGALGVAIVLLVLALIASFMHLGRPVRAWRAVLMWRTSWLSREVIVLPSFIALVAAWWFAWRIGAPALWSSLLLPLACIVAAALLWWCTAMIYACLRFIAEWSHPLTVATYALTGLASGAVLAGALAAFAGEATLARVLAPAALALTLVAAAARVTAIRRNDRLVPRSTAQSATGIAAMPLVQRSMGMSAGAFNTREFFHGASPGTLATLRAAALGLGYAAPLACVAWALGGGRSSAWALAVSIQVPGLLADRWLFFAQARHPQNLYYQTVS